MRHLWHPEFRIIAGIVIVALSTASPIRRTNSDLRNGLALLGLAAGAALFCSGALGGKRQADVDAFPVIYGALWMGDGKEPIVYQRHDAAGGRLAVVFQAQARYRACAYRSATMAEYARPVWVNTFCRPDIETRDAAVREVEAFLHICTTCGYCLYGNNSGACPECGTKTA